MLHRRNVLFGLVVALYALAFPYHPGLRSPNELSRLWQTRALVEHGSLSLNETIRRYGPVGDLSIKDGRLFPSKAPLLSFAAVPLYAGLRALVLPRALSEPALAFVSRLFLTVLPTLVLLVIIRRFLDEYLTPAMSDVMTVTYAAGSLALSYSLLFMSHQTSAVLLFASFFATWRSERANSLHRGSLLGGMFAGLAVAAEYTAALPAICIGGYVGCSAILRSRAEGKLGLRGSSGSRGPLVEMARVLGPFLAGAFPVLAALMAYHQAAFGHPLHSGYKYLADAAYQPWHEGGFLGIRTPDPRAFSLSFFSPLRGLFTLAPFLFLALPGLYYFWSARKKGTALGNAEHTSVGALSVVLLIGFTYFTSSFSYESWGWTTGPRHLTALVPFLLLPAGQMLEVVRKLGHPWPIGVAGGLCATSIVVTGLVSLVNYIPDDVSSPLFALALPLFWQGFLPPTALHFIGVANPWSGALVMALVLGIAAWVLLVACHDRPEWDPAALPPNAPRWPFWIAAASGVALTLTHLGILAALTRHDAHDQSAVQHLKSVWMTPRGRTVPFLLAPGERDQLPPQGWYGSFE